jgi:hypothetical protein
MGEASFHVGNHTNHTGEDEAKQLRDEIRAIREQLSQEIVELDRRRREAVVKMRKFSVWAVAGAVGALLLFSLLPLGGDERSNAV